MSLQEDTKMMQALSEEAGGQALLRHCEYQVKRAQDQWLREIDPDSEEVPNERVLLLKKIKYQADMGAYRRVIGFLTAPKEKDDE